MAQLRSVTCRMDSHSVTCYPIQVNIPRLNPSHAGCMVLDLPTTEGWKAELTYDFIAPRPGVEPATFRSRVQRSTNVITKTTGWPWTTTNCCFALSYGFAPVFRAYLHGVAFRYHHINLNEDKPIPSAAKCSKGLQFSYRCQPNSKSHITTDLFMFITHYGK